MDFIKGKLTKKLRIKIHGSCDSSDLLELIHTGICGPFPTPSRGGQKYYISFIDDHSQFAYIYLLHHKSKALDAFKLYKAEVENQLDRKIKVVLSDRGGEYYCKNDQDGINQENFIDFLRDNGIVP